MFDRPLLTGSIALALSSAFFATEPAIAAVFVVDSLADGADLSLADGHCLSAAGTSTLRAAVQQANSDPAADAIILSAGVYGLSIGGQAEDLGAQGDLDIRSSLSLRGAGAAATTIDAQGLDRVVDLSSTGVTIQVAIEGLSIRGGHLPASPGQNNGAGLRIGHAVNLSLTNVVVHDNQALRASSGGVGIDNAGCLHGQGLRVIDNQDPQIAPFSRAGGIATRGVDSCLQLFDSEISRNRAAEVGGIYADQGAPVHLQRSLIAHNSAQSAGALISNGGNLVTLENCTISHNRGDVGILNDGGAVIDLRHCTITGNRATPPSFAIVGGILDVHGGFGLVFASNTIIANNGPGSLAPDCNSLQSTGGNLIGDSQGCALAAQASDLLDASPELSGLADHGGFTATHLPGAAALDNAVVSNCVAFDQRGRSRPRDGDGDGIADCDRGAVELDDPGQLLADGFESAGSVKLPESTPELPPRHNTGQ